MRHNIQVLDRIRKTYASLRPSEQRVADYVLNHPETCTQQTISELADQVQVSQPTVVRFVQARGFGGFRNFKYCLLRDRSQGTEREAYFDHLGGFDLKPWDQLEDLPLKEVRVSGGLLEAALKSLSPQELDRAVPGVQLLIAGGGSWPGRNSLISMGWRTPAPWPATF